MIIPDKKRVTTIILSRMKDGKRVDMPVKPEAEMQPDPDDEPLSIAAQDMMQAINDKSIIGLKQALKSFIDLIQADDSKPSEEES